MQHGEGKEDTFLLSAKEGIKALEKTYDKAKSLFKGPVTLVPDNASMYSFTAGKWLRSVFTPFSRSLSYIDTALYGKGSRWGCFFYCPFNPLYTIPSSFLSSAVDGSCSHDLDEGKNFTLKVREVL